MQSLGAKTPVPPCERPWVRALGLQLLLLCRCTVTALLRRTFAQQSQQNNLTKAETPKEVNNTVCCYALRWHAANNTVCIKM